MRTLLLNASYSPLAVISWRRAVVLVMEGKADVVADSDIILHSPSTEMTAPAVIRLRYFVKVPYRATIPLTRRALLARDGHRCAYCAGKADTIDHVIPRARGGANVWENVVAACKPCNNRKDDHLLDELCRRQPQDRERWTLDFTPTAPKGWSWVTIGVGTVDPAWEPYVTAVA